MDERVQRVTDFLKRRGISADIIEFETSTKNSQLAARALNCPVAQIAKSIVFAGDETVVVILSGDRKVDLKKLSKLLSSPVSLADADTVLHATGFPVGGVPPFAHIQPLRVMLDKSLDRFSEVYAAGGVPNAIFRIGLIDLKALSKAESVDIAA